MCVRVCVCGPFAPRVKSSVSVGSSGGFQRVYEDAIVTSRRPGASDAERTLGETRAAELTRVTGEFVLRRTQEVNTRYLPPKGEGIAQ